MICNSVRLLYSLLAALTLFLISFPLQARVIPQPSHIEYTHGKFEFNSSTQWEFADTTLVNLAEPFLDQLERATHIRPRCRTGMHKSRNVVQLTYVPGLTDEAYRLTVDPNRIRIEASAPRGFFYAFQTLFQLMPDSVYAFDKWMTRGIYKARKAIRITVPGVRINDEPRFGYRGFMLDVARYFMPKDEVLKLIGYLAMHKINVLHLHLVDDNGWRVEIKKYPRLTETGARRVDRIASFPLRTNPDPGESAVKGGYYSQNDIREIVAYAALHQIEVIPEIEMPAHTNSSLAAYPQLACPVAQPVHGVLPGGGGNRAAVLYCAGNDSVFSFLEDVLQEVMDLFPSRFIHIGGDEAIKTHWKNCPLCQTRMKENSISNEEELQSYFIDRINNFILGNGRRLMGWDELADNSIPEKSVILGWRGAGKGGETAGAKGFKYIKSPAWYYYFIRYQGPQWFEPFTYFGNTTLKDVYTYEPLPDTLESSTAVNMLGVQACLWTEFVHQPADAYYLIFPRLAAFAESAWSRPGNRNWNDFSAGMQQMLRRYTWLGIPYARSMYNIQHRVKPYEGYLRVSLSAIMPDHEIRFTLDGSEPEISSAVYADTLLLEPGTQLRAALFNRNERQGEILSLQTLRHKAAGQTVVSDDPTAGLLVNGVRGSEKLTDGEWVDLYNRDGLFEIRWKDTISVSRIGTGLLNNAGMGIHFPSSIEFFYSSDGVNFIPLYRYGFSEYERFQQGHFRTTHYAEFEKKSVKALRILVKNPGITPGWHLRSGTTTRAAIDEISVE